jgi:hypothetical protein
MIIIGSRAMALQFNHIRRVTAKTDYDVIMGNGEFPQWIEDNKSHIKSLIPRSANKYKAIVENVGKRVQYEIELGFEGTSSKWLLDHKDEVCYGTVTGFLSESFDALDPDYLLLTKRSHLIYPIHFEKNIEDYQFMKKRVTSYKNLINDNPLMKEYYTLRANEAKERFKQKTPKLNVTTEDFFSSKLPVPTYFVHDHIHKIMAHDSVPMYTKMQPDPGSAWCSKDMFFNLSFREQIQCVQEEAYVIALERYIIPQFGDNCNDYRDCYKRAVKRICTTLTSGWFRDFAIENYDRVIAWYDGAYVEKFIKKFNEGEIKYKDRVNTCPLMEVKNNG